MQPSHPFSSPSPLAFNLSLHQGLFHWASLCLRWPKYWSFSISPSNEYSGLISSSIDCIDFLAIQGTLLLQHHSLNTKRNKIIIEALFLVQQLCAGLQTSSAQAQLCSGIIWGALTIPSVQAVIQNLGCSSGISIFKSPPSAIIQSHVQPRWRTSALSYSVSQILGSIRISRISSGGEESCR